MDSELRDFLENFARAFDRKFEKLEAEIRDLRNDMHDLREEMRAMRADLREQSQRIGNVSTDYYEARRVRDLRTIGLEARVNELERRLSELEGGGR